MLRIIEFKFTIVILALLTSITPAFSGEINANSFAGKITKTNDYRINWAWWEKFNDPTLYKLLQQSVKSNFDLQIAELKVKEAENYANSSKRGFFPSVRLGGGYSYTKYSDLTPYGRGVSYNPDNSNNNLIVLPLQVSYELDFWGKNRTKTDYFLENKDFYEFEKTFLTLNTLAEVSTLYFNIIKNQKLISLYEQISDLKQQKLHINRQKLELRLVTKPAVIEAEKELKLSLEKTIFLKALNNDLKNRLNLLVYGDTEPESIYFNSIDNINMLYDEHLTISTHNIKYRPDILMAEKQIKMAKLDADAVRKSFLPSFAITGDLFQITDFFKQFFSARSFRYRAGSGILYDLFNKKSNTAELQAKKLLYEQMLKNYEKTIVTSINEINNSLYYLKSSMKEFKRTKEISGLEGQMVDIEKQKLDMDLITYDNFLKSKEKYINSKVVQYESRTQWLIHTISLYKALGGNV